MTDLSTLLTVSKYTTVLSQPERSSESYNCIVFKDYRFQRYILWNPQYCTYQPVYTGIYSGEPTYRVVWWCMLKVFKEPTYMFF